MEIREQTDEEVGPVIAAAFGERRVVELAAALHRSSSHLVSLVALDPDAVGHVQLSRSWVDDPTRLVEVAVLSPLSVTPDRQGQGIGTALVEAALGWARAAGESYVFLEGDPRYYAHRGFGAAALKGFTKPSVRIPDAAFQVAVLHDGGVRGALAYADPFWRLDCVGLR